MEGDSVKNCPSRFAYSADEIAKVYLLRLVQRQSVTNYVV